MLLDRAEVIANEFDYGLYDMRFVKPLDQKLLDEVVKNYEKVITLEDHTTVGGSGSAVNEYFAHKKYLIPVMNLGLNDVFPPHGSRNQVLQLNGLDIESLKEKISSF